ncbi:hypothetical protein GCM10010168_28150 [Actinoplanes ianthinogenes]|uniref:Uncharacterized protein n=1 Tax=Actinoplanes ianthinogenes TaxID=122358 RepID=A0ABM7LL12_9ACTN|nr:hypothetical protein [Actinoplanes ianthinogenes]BCJ39956.1 hypothetical protein Aiant_06130 [Actinoplanes ianthinogenes]GGR09273.1 hypothetical protein GCM10010168_28150 [Actinoplanes ianthinogenes]
MDVLQHGEPGAAPNRPSRRAVITAVVVAAALAAVALAWHHHGRPAAAPASSPSPTASPIRLDFLGDYHLNQQDDGEFLLGFVLLNNTGRDVTVEPDRVPAIPGITDATATLLPANRLGGAAPPDPRPTTLPRGGKVTYALQGHLSCTAESPTPIPAHLRVDQEAVTIPLPDIDGQDWATFLRTTMCPLPSAP